MKTFSLITALILLPFAFHYLVKKPAAWIELKIKGAKQ